MENKKKLYTKKIVFCRRTKVRLDCFVAHFNIIVKEFKSFMQHDDNDECMPLIGATLTKSVSRQCKVTKSSRNFHDPHSRYPRKQYHSALTHPAALQYSMLIDIILTEPHRTEHLCTQKKLNCETHHI